MADPGSHEPRQRLGARGPVEEPAEIVIEHTKRFNRRIEVASAVWVRDVSISGASLVLGSDLSLNVGQVFELRVDGQHSSARVRWIRDEAGSGGGAAGGLVCGVEFIDPDLSFLPTVQKWLERQPAIGTSSRST